MVEQARGSSSELERAAALALPRLMCVDAECCRQSLPVLFAALDSPGVDSTVKNSLLASLADLLHRFPNEVEPHQRTLCAVLLDPSAQVRRCMLVLLTHLYLHDMVRLRN